MRIMDIKRLLNLNLFTPVKAQSRVNQVNQNDKSQDRDANGQEQYQQQPKEENREMSEAEFNEAVEAFKQLPAVIEHNWKITTAIENSKKVLILKDNLGNLIRKIPDYDLWDIKKSSSHTNIKGTLLKKTA